MSSRLHHSVQVEVFPDLSLFGVLLLYFRTFVQICGGRSALSRLTTFKVMERFVKPRTKVSQLSLC
jgi:hypothetical protein